ncbi:hypothetical protein [Scytonema sp. NUACC26]|uniref:hypothetical protein n=1 Tax=Scytonema sp. NUACC26 TaxID=3140176 RepID=UPI0038B26CB1
MTSRVGIAHHSILVWQWYSTTLTQSNLLNPKSKIQNGVISQCRYIWHFFHRLV